MYFVPFSNISVLSGEREEGKLAAKQQRYRKSTRRRKLFSGKFTRKLRMPGQRRRNRREKHEILAVLNWAWQIALVCLIAFVLVWFWGQRVSNIGDSMNPVLKNGDVVLVDRILYNASRPKRGDVIVFRPNGNENSNYSIKRIVGLPGETVQIKDGYVYINGKELEEEKTASKIESAGIAEEEVTLAGDEYFVLGDNRSASMDSRDADIGNVKRSEIYGKAWIRVSPISRFGFLKK